MSEEIVQEGTGVEETATTETTEETVDETQTVDYWKKRAADAEATIIKHKKETKKEEVKKEVAQTGTPDSYQIERAVLEATGWDDGLLDNLQKIAKLNNTTLLKAQKDPIFIALKEQFEREKRVEAAQVGASSGSGSRPVQKGFNTPNLSREDHMKLVQEAAKNLRI